MSYQPPPIKIFFIALFFGINRQACKWQCVVVRTISSNQKLGRLLRFEALKMSRDQNRRGKKRLELPIRVSDLFDSAKTTASGFIL